MPVHPQLRCIRNSQCLEGQKCMEMDVDNRILMEALTGQDNAFGECKFLTADEEAEVSTGVCISKGKNVILSFTLFSGTSEARNSRDLFILLNTFN